MKKVQLKNLVTEVPDNAELVIDWSKLQENQFVLIVWDNPKFPAGVEKNNRLYTKITRVEKFDDRTEIGFGGHYTEKADKLNATTCNCGWKYQKKNESESVMFPHVIFLVD